MSNKDTPDIPGLEGRNESYFNSVCEEAPDLCVLDENRRAVPWVGDAERDLTMINCCGYLYMVDNRKEIDMHALPVMPGSWGKKWNAFLDDCGTLEDGKRQIH